MTAAARSAAAACVATERLRKGGELAWAKSMAGGEIGLESAALVANRSGKGEGWGEAVRSAEEGQGK
jgi:hypothetical protein